MMDIQKLVILDRDGVINYDSPHYIKSPAEWQAIPGSLEAMARLHRAGWQVVIATNQSGVARGLFDMETLNQIHTKMLQELAVHGGRVAGIFFCPHAPGAGCECRKPKPGMFLDIAARFNISLQGVLAVGDALRDLHAALVAGATPVLVKTGKGMQTYEELSGTGLTQVAVYDNLAAVVDALDV